ncbi:CAP domain-containing protein [Alicyclobacillus kakegawensis]|uniref:CAP domain-containing protein n=1 Tax=Alicyclobacillus kakegawensis TaxID=392012 RepID=UPI000836A30E|nr:CAP domain-containing protein [Alicyclobacillus kakegawensis]
MKKPLLATAASIAALVMFGTSAYASTSATYVVRPNDTLWQIAHSHGVSLSSLIQANPQIQNPNSIWVGEKIQLPASGQTSSSPSIQQQYATEVANLVNQARAKAGLKPLTVSAKLSALAMQKASDMYQNHYFSHISPTYGSPFDMMQKEGFSFTYAGENIAEGQTSPQQVMQDWMNSPGHRANILNAHFDTIGVAYDHGVWVQEFIGHGQ